MLCAAQLYPAGSHTEPGQKSHKGYLRFQQDLDFSLQLETRGQTHGESGEQVGEHLRGQRALPPAHEGVQSVSEDAGYPIHIHIPHELQLHKKTKTSDRHRMRKRTGVNDKLHLAMSSVQSFGAARAGSWSQKRAFQSK